MRGSVEVQQFLMRESAKAGEGTGVPTQRVSGTDTPRVSDDQVRRARAAVASNALDAGDCARLLDMLGLVSEDDGVPPVQR